MKLTLCPACHRHVKAAEPMCPFCSAAMQNTSRPPLAAAMMLGLGLAVAGCSSNVTPLYGGPPEDAATQDARTNHTDANVSVLYGPAHEGDAAKDTEADANHAVMYGPAPAPDASTDGGMAGAYAPPPVADAGDTAVGRSTANNRGA